MTPEAIAADPEGAPDVLSLLPPDSADLTLLQDRQVAVLGYGPTAASHALNLRDSGVDVRIGLSPDSRAAGRAEVEGLLVVEVEAACRQADLVLLPADDGIDHAAVVPGLQALLEPGDMLLLTGIRDLATWAQAVPAGVDVAVLQSIGGPERARTEYLDGRGAPCLTAVHTDATGVAWAVLTAYAQALGALRSGAIRTTVAELGEAATVGRDVHERVFGQVREGFDSLVGAGITPAVAYLAVVEGLKERVDAVHDSGYAAQYGPGGDAAGGVGPGASRRAANEDAIELERVGRQVRALMSWIR